MTSRILKEMHETARGMHDAGTLNLTTMREFDALCLSPVDQLSAAQIKRVRTQSKVSQPVFAKFLNLNVSTIRQWENGDKVPSGASLKLLNIVRKKGLDAIA